jgi:branched-chain amino acid aminotransferase
MPDQVVYINHQFVPAHSASVPVFDRCFLYGDGLFETIRVSSSHPRHWALHFARLSRGARFLHIPIPFPSEQLLPHAIELIRLNAMPDALLRINLSRGIGARGYSPTGATHPTLVMSLHPIPNSHEAHPPAWHLITSSIRVPARDPLTRFKTCNRLPYVLARQEAQEAGADDALLLNHDGHAVESSCANLFWIQNDVILTPPLDSGPLDGVTRSRLFDLAPKLPAQIVEQDIQLDQLRTRTGLFLTLTSHGLVQIATLDRHPIPAHPLIAKIHTALQDP